VRATLTRIPRTSASHARAALWSVSRAPRWINPGGLLPAHGVPGRSADGPRSADNGGGPQCVSGKVQAMTLLSATKTTPSSQQMGPGVGQLPYAKRRQAAY